jgi:hypothetical protein
MANLTLSGYLVTEVTVAFSGTQTLDSLADNEYTNWSDEIDNSTHKYRLADIRIVLGSAAFTGADSGIELYLIPTVDGTNYPTWTGNGTADEQENVPFYVDFAPTTATTSAQAMVLRDVALPNGKYRFAVRSRANVALAASGNTIYFRPHTVAV